MRYPFLQSERAEAAIEAQRGFVPVEHRPFEAREVFAHATLRELREQRTTDAAPAMFGAHEQVLEVDPGPAEEAGQRLAAGIGASVAAPDLWR